MYDEILLPTIGSPGGERAVAEAIDLAELTGARLHILYVVEDDSRKGLADGRWETIREALRSEARDVLTDVESKATAAGVEAVTHVGEGRADEAITDYASEEGIDAIVMGTHARTGVNKFLLGSVTENVIRRAEQPVLVVRLDEE
ncbi:universal stress protein [Natranaeroarchaeum aerophilus]|uniref:Universal stress protein n=1 Tax=Natranaeroarchaeum aerophilus TaxID=2917711 RepID=A0AAE3FPS2_9EURY|nr:universal stress protein [Natranaeroarchaeum aerophilus]MCL9812404.1 universal stress protein [Natranaeroarchaeum aerophilus]